MADGGSGIQQVTEEIAQTAGGVIEDVKDSVGEAIEQGVQSVVGTQITPQQIQPALPTQRGEQKQQQDQKDLSEARRKIAFYQNVGQEQKQVIQENKQKEMDRLQGQQQEEQVKVQKFQIQTSKKAGLSEEILRSQAERKVGKGIGG